MKTPLSRIGAALATAGLLVSSTALLTAPAAHAAPGDGTLVVNVVDQYDRPVDGMLIAFNANGDQFLNDDGGTPAFTSRHTLELPAEGYSFQSVTPWGGLVCTGITHCDLLTGSVSGLTPVVTVAADQVANYTLRVSVPSIAGSGATGEPISLQLPSGLTALSAIFSAIPGLGTATSAQQWVRGATDIAGATGQTYSPTSADWGQSVSARLTPAPGTSYLFASLGASVPAFATNAIAVPRPAKSKTKTKLALPKTLAVGERATLTIKVTAKGGTPEGKVTLRIGKLKIKKSLKDGEALITMPRLEAGTYKVKVKYAGSELFKKSKRKKSLTILKK